MVKRVLIPQFSIRWMLMVTAACAGVFSFFGLAVRGHLWAVGVSVAIASVAVVLLVHAAVFALVWAFAEFGAWYARRTGRGRSPFAVAVPTGGAALGPPSPTGHDRDRDEPAAPIILD